nr:MAG TPA: hypothetical protein [Caudoviricetes sp.]
MDSGTLILNGTLYALFIIFIKILKFPSILLKLGIITTSIYLGKCILTSLFLLE